MLLRPTALIRGLATAALGFVVFCARADAAPAKVGQVMAVKCRIRVTAEGEAIRIEAVANSLEEVSGRYRFDIRKDSASGISNNIQSGEFSLAADREQVLSTTFLGASDAGHFQARLVLDAGSGSVSCVSP
jgi:curli production assembly/transport CsgH protein